MRAAPPTSSLRRPDWRDQGACLGEDPDLFTPDGTTGHWAKAIEQAKTICRRCPVTDSCTAWALNTPQAHGIYGGLTDDERRSLRRRTSRDTHHPRGPKQSNPTSLSELLNRYTSPADGGHLMWTGGKTPDFGRRQYTPNQVAFIVDRGYEPDGSVHRTCEVRGCVQPLHLADTEERRQQAAQKAAVSA